MDDNVIKMLGTFLLIFTRIITFFIQAPIWGSKHFPKQILIGMAACLSVILYPSIPIPENFPDSMGNYVLAILSQILVGLIIGYIAYIVLAAVEFAGQMIDIQMGISIAASFDPALKGSSNMLRRFEFYLAMLLYLFMGWHHFLIKALFKTYEVIPLTGLNFSGKLILELIQVTAALIIIGLKIAGPVLAALFIIQVALGMLARAAPQMNVFMLSFPLNIFVGLAILKVTFECLGTALQGYLDINYNVWLVDAVKYMIPK